MIFVNWLENCDAANRRASGGYAVRPLRWLVSDSADDIRRFLVIPPGDPSNLGPAIEVEH